MKDKRYKSVTKRPSPFKIKLDFDVIQELAGLQCTEKEIADYLKCSVKTLQRSEEFRLIFAQAKAQGQIELRRLQWDAVKKGNPVSLIWMGKQHLGQKDKHESEHTGNVGIKIISGVPRPKITEIKPPLLTESTEQPLIEQ